MSIDFHTNPILLRERVTSLPYELLPFTGFAGVTDMEVGFRVSDLVGLASLVVVGDGLVEAVHPGVTLIKERSGR